MKVCIFAAACDVAACQEVLRALPADAYGQVYVADETATLGAPERVQVNRVTSRPGRCALTEALSGWSAEWLPECAASTQESPTVWVLPGASATLSASGDDAVRRLITVLPTEQLLHG